MTTYCDKVTLKCVWVGHTYLDYPCVLCSRNKMKPKVEDRYEEVK